MGRRRSNPAAADEYAPRRCLHCGMPVDSDQHCPECDPALPVGEDDEDLIAMFPRGESWPRSFGR